MPWDAVVGIVALLASVAITTITLRFQQQAEARRSAEARLERENDRWMVEKRIAYSEFNRASDAWHRNVARFMPQYGQWEVGRPLDWAIVLDPDRTIQCVNELSSALAEISIIGGDKVRPAAAEEVRTINRQEYDLRNSRAYLDANDYDTFREIQRGVSSIYASAIDWKTATRNFMYEDLVPREAAEPSQ